MDSTLKSSSSNSSREELLRSTKELCNVFASHGTIEEIISCFSSKGQSNSNNSNDDNDSDDDNEVNNYGNAGLVNNELEASTKN